MKTKQALLGVSPIDGPEAKTNESRTVAIEQRQGVTLYKRIFMVAILAVSCLLVKMSTAADAKTEFERVDNVYKKCESRHRHWSESKQKDDKKAGWQELEKLRGEWRAAKDYFIVRSFPGPWAIINHSKTDAKWAAENADKVRKAKATCTPYYDKVAKMEEDIETWTISLRPTLKSNRK